MKVYNVTNRLSAQARRELVNIIDTHEKYRNSYFFRPATNSSSRRRNERIFWQAHPDVSFLQGENLITVTMKYEESSRNVYYRMTVIIKNGKEERIGNISTIKKLLK